MKISLQKRKNALWWASEAVLYKIAKLYVEKDVVYPSSDASISHIVGKLSFL